ncbi:MAG: AsmA family protein, partial [Planctomycetota bacterium]|nr:AsmA family protein [Planctomycetota bacterium]
IGPIRPDQEQPVAALSGTLRFAWPSTAATALLLGQTVPELGAVEGRLSVSGTPEVLRFSDVRIEARSTDGLESSARGEVGRITFDPKFAVGAVRLDLNAKSESTDLVAQLFGHAWPEFGEVRASSRLNGGPDIFALDDFTVSVGPADQPLLRVAGAIKDLVALKGIKLDGEFKVPAARFLRPGPPEDAAKLGELQGRFVLSDADGTIGLEVLSIEVVGSNLLTASLEGVFDDIADTDLLSLQGSLRVPDPAALGRVFGLEDLDLASLAFEGRLSGSNEAFTAEGETRVGKTALTGTMTGSFAGERPKFVARLTSPVFYFEDFGLTPEPDAAAGEQQAPVAERKDVAAKRLFSDEPLPFERLSAIDLDLEILLDELDGVSLDIDQAQLHLVLENGVLTIDPLRFNLVGGLAEIRASADTTPTFPELSLDVRIDDLDLGDLLGQLKADVPLDGELDLILNLQAIGRSPRELADSLTGEIDLALARGAVRTRLFALTALDLGSWLFARSTRRGYSELNCLILRFDVVDGEAESKVLVIDTANVRAMGDGTVDLGDEQLKIEFSPRAKRRRIIRLATPFSIEGPLSQPTLRVSSSGAAGRMIGGIVAKPINLLGRLLPFVSDRNKDVDNPCLRLEPVEDIEIPTEG